MNKKIVIIIVLIIIFSCFIIYGTSNSHITVGKASFMIPSEYKSQNTSNNPIVFTSGEKNLYLNGNVNYTSVNDSVQAYVDYKNNKENMSVDISHLNSNGFDIYKAVVINNPSTVHYWFIKENQIYEIYTGTADSNTDHIVLDIIKS